MKQGDGAVAIFDLDGTLLNRDSLLPYLMTFCARRRWLFTIVCIVIILGLYACGVLRARKAKEKLLIFVFRRTPLSEIEEHNTWFVNSWLMHHVREPVLQLLQQHQRHGDRTILLSASPDLYVPKIAEKFGFTDCVCTRVAVEHKTVLGTILGPNCCAQAKLGAMRDLLGTTHAPEPSYAYGDSSGDVWILEWVQHGYWITKSGTIVPLADPSCHYRKRS